MPAAGIEGAGAEPAERAEEENPNHRLLIRGDYWHLSARMSNTTKDYFFSNKLIEKNSRIVMKLTKSY